MEVDRIFNEIPSCSAVQPSRSEVTINIHETLIKENIYGETDNNDPDFNPALKNYDTSDSEDDPIAAPSNLPDDNILEDENPRRKRSTKYEVNRNEWYENRNRINREKGKSYLGKKKENGKWRYDIVQKPRLLKEACNCKLSANPKCILKCRQIAENEREIIFTQFWKYTWPEKKMFVKNHVSVETTSRKRGYREVSRRSYSHKFFLGKARLRVCKVMFLNTLGVNEWVIKKWTKNSDQVHFNQTEIPDKINTSVRLLHEFFETLPKLESHYCRTSTAKLYLEPIWNSKAHLYKVYKNDYCKTRNEKSVSIATFHKEFDKKRLSLYKPKKDLCDCCVAYQTGNLTEEKYNEHITLKNEARNEKSADKESQDEVLAMDLQSVLLSPKSNVSSLYYKTKLIVHNFTIFDVKRKQGYCYLWNESEGGLTSNEFSSIIIIF